MCRAKWQHELGWERDLAKAGWVWKPHQAAAYAGVPEIPVHLKGDYVTKSEPLVEEQLVNAGIRLAFELHNAFR